MELFVDLFVFTHEDIARYYDLSETHYRRIWHLEQSRSLHYGFWDESTKNFHEALLNINRVLANRVEIKAGEKILDAGCGVGGSSIWLARERDCFVTGISLNERQIAKANAFASELKMREKLLFEQKDYSATGYPAQSFDVVWAIESICYANDKGTFLQEACRLLKPGGRLIMADFFKTDGLQPQQEALVKKWAHGWAINDFSTVKEFELKSKENHFQEIEFTDITNAILPSARKLYRSYFMGVIGAAVYQLFHPRATALGKNNVHNASLQYKTLKKRLWTYQMVKAAKPR